ncbi:hypothetical protein ES703_93752 [subsurface metagenome]
MLLCKNPVVENEFADPSSAAAASPLPLRRVDSCGVCQSCRLLEAGSHPDFHLIYKELLEFTKDGKGKTTPVDLPVDVVREFLIEKVSIKPTLSARKVFIVSEAERLNASSQNAMLKVLEEPPQYCSIILLCTRMERLLPTTKSRCQIIRFAPIAEDRIIGKMKEMGIEEKRAQYFARLSQGSLGQACRWAELEFADTNLYQIKKELVNSLATCELADALDLAGQVLDESKKIAAVWADLDKATSRTDINRRAAKTLVQIIISVKGLINFDQKEQIKKLASRFDTEQAAEKIADCYRTLRWIDSSVNEKLIFEELLLNLAVSDKITVS